MKNSVYVILRIQQRHYKRFDEMSIGVKGVQFVTPYPNKDKNAHTYMYTAKGIFEIYRHSNQNVADEFYDYVYGVAIEISQNGYYISNEKDETKYGKCPALVWKPQ